MGKHSDVWAVINNGREVVPGGIKDEKGVRQKGRPEKKEDQNAPRKGKKSQVIRTVRIHVAAVLERKDTPAKGKKKKRSGSAQNAKKKSRLEKSRKRGKNNIEKKRGKPLRRKRRIAKYVVKKGKKAPYWLQKEETPEGRKKKKTSCGPQLFMEGKRKGPERRVWEAKKKKAGAFAPKKRRKKKKKKERNPEGGGKKSSTLNEKKTAPLPRRP